KNQREFATNAGSRMLKAWFSAAACMASVAVGGVAHAADPYPSKPVTLVVPFATGGATDIVGRVLADRLSKELGQQVIVENKAGAGGITGSQYVLDKPADGYTLLLAISSKTVMTELQEKAPYDPLKDFQTVSLIAK